MSNWIIHRFLPVSSNTDISDYIDNLLINRFLPVTIMPTRITSHSVTLIDHIYYLETLKKKDDLYIRSGNFLKDISDHLPNYILLISDNKQYKSQRPMVRIFSESNISNPIQSNLFEATKYKVLQNKIKNK